MFVWGYNGFHQLGLENEFMKDSINIPTEIIYFSNKKISQISGGHYHSIAISGKL